jgi:hypothetical protein
MLISVLVYPVYPRSEDGKARCRSNTTTMIYFDLQPTLRLVPASGQLPATQRLRSMPPSSRRLGKSVGKLAQHTLQGSCYVPASKMTHACRFLTAEGMKQALDDQCLLCKLHATHLGESLGLDPSRETDSARGGKKPQREVVLLSLHWNFFKTCCLLPSSWLSFRPLLHTPTVSLFFLVVHLPPRAYSAVFLILHFIHSLLSTHRDNHEP